MAKLELEMTLFLSAFIYVYLTMRRMQIPSSGMWKRWFLPCPG